MNEDKTFSEIVEAKSQEITTKMTSQLFKFIPLNDEWKKSLERGILLAVKDGFITGIEFQMGKK